MQLLDIREFNDLLRNCKYRAFHLETQDEYAVDSEADDLAEYLKTGTFDETWSSWENLIKEVTDKGIVVQRARVVSEPHTDYTRFLHATTRINIASGEDVRWLPRSDIDPTQLTTDDWWTLDDEVVAFTAFRTDGNLGGLAVTTDPVIVQYCNSVREVVWSVATPHAEYFPKQ
ncbi:hypothetical protein OHB26_03870 [Nocardia sp. NBC_01503]|uniref:DUF6879 family protein n=1 Tax=Nocardia sp. NBC_01503 TaxID=2975997 RepID=UPI002E7C070D|nr:DUF6879 family protein [Nocardia sp. NBC_01503]WTL33394.1 hypothetical protein OHB26_03870 [Nocardia sp. NBC_01503]